MNIFSLLSVNSDPVKEDESVDITPSTLSHSTHGPDESHDDSNFSDNDYMTPRDTDTSSLITPRSPFSTPPRSPPRSTSNIETRLRLRRNKPSLSPKSTPVSSPIKSCSMGYSSGVDPSSSIAATKSPVDVTRTAVFDDTSHKQSAPPSSHSSYSTPTSSPTKSDLHGLSPLQQRLERARTKRERIMEERIQTIDIKIKTKEVEATKRKEDVRMEKITKARTEDSIQQAKERRDQLEVDKQLHMLTLRAKEEEALQRKEGVTMERVEKARKKHSILQAKKRRDDQLTQRVQTVEAYIESKSKEATRRVESYLLQKQHRACRKEQKERAEQRRKLLWYERRAKLLNSLDGKLERAVQRSNEFTNEKAVRAREELARAKDVAKKVKAARVIQEFARDVYGFKKCESNESELSHHEAAARLQKWGAWRAAICKRRLANRSSTILDELLQLFLAPSADGNNEKKRSGVILTFEALTMQMRRPDIKQEAASIIECLLPMVDIHFASSSSSNKGVDGRSLLTLFLIAAYPEDVLGDDYDDAIDESAGDDEDANRCARGTKQLANAAGALLKSFSLINHSSQLTTGDLGSIGHLYRKSFTLFNWWKQMDLEQLLAGLSKQLQQCWVVYITSSETLKYLEKVTGFDDNDPNNLNDSKRDDPLMQLRLRHKASLAGSRSHIKRIRVSLNKLIGSDEGREVVIEAKVAARKEIEETQAVQILKQEVDEMNIGFEANNAEDMESILVPDVSHNDAAQDSTDEVVHISSILPNEVTSNPVLIHRVLVTDPADFDKLSCDGVVSQSPDVSLEEYMSTFVLETERESEEISPSDLPMRIAEQMKIAFFKGIAQELGAKNYNATHDLMKDLHDKMRSLLPNRTDLHSHINDDDISDTSCTLDIIRVLLRSGHLLANYLESPSRAESTRELLMCLESFSCSIGDNESTSTTIPFGIESEHLFVIASIAFLLQKEELCQMDVSNYKFSQLAPHIQQVGREYERSHFKKAYGDYSTVSTGELRQMLPSTAAWIKKALEVFQSTDNITAQSSIEQKLDFIKGRCFVDGILFTKNELTLPEIFSLDIEEINSIRNEARCCVIASALTLHSCNIIGSPVSKIDVGDDGTVLMSILRKRHFRRDDLESDIVAALTSFTATLAKRSLTTRESETLKNHTLAVLRGEDPVLKLLDNRIRGYFRYACRWTPGAKASAPAEMKTGRNIVNGNADFNASHGSNKAGFSLAASKEAKRMGFAFVSSDLITVGNKARLIVSVACSNYGRDVLSRLIVTE